VLSTWKNHFQNGQKIPFQYTLFPCNVQGKDASQSMIIALERIYKMYLNKDNAYSYADTDIDHLSSTNLRIDCILMVRGGGSWHDLSGFNDEQLALTMAKSPLCIITGVGHSEDVTIAQKMASIQADTPTASAAVILKRWDFVFKEYEGLKTQFNSVFQKRLDQENQRLQQYQQRFITQQKRFFQTQQTILNNYSQKLHRVYQQKIADKQQDCRMLSERLINLTKQRINHEQQQTMFMKQKLLQSQLAIQHQLKSYQLELALLKSKLEHANPRALINKGFAVILPPKNQGNKLKSSIRDFPLQQSFRIVLKDGIVTGETVSVEERDHKKS
jgi:exodeoxyribonuclease VII large subunit